MLLELIIKTIYFMLPAYFANMAPVLVKDYFKFLAIPLDFNKKINNKPILGAHKTLRGLIFGIIAGIIIAFIQSLLYKYNFFTNISLIDYSNWLLIGFLMSFGALVGDSVKSFFKRIIDIKPGKKWIPFDQLDYTIGALVFVFFVYIPPASMVGTALILSFILHIIANHLAYYLGIRKVKW